MNARVLGGLSFFISVGISTWFFSVTVGEGMAKIFPALNHTEPVSERSNIRVIRLQLQQVWPDGAGGLPFPAGFEHEILLKTM